MPRYLSKNYFKLRAREIEELIDRCLLVSPGEHFTASSQREDPYRVWELREYKDIFNNTSSVWEQLSIEEELKGLCAAVCPVECVGECEKDRDPWDMSYEMDIIDYGGYFSQEAFHKDNTYVYCDWVPVSGENSELLMSYFFEEMETCDLLSLEPDRYYPSIDRLISRWKSKPVTDPLLGGDGQPLLTEVTFLREDTYLDVDMEARNVVTEEEFNKEVAADGEVVTVKGVISLLEEPNVPGTHNIPIDYLFQALEGNKEMSPLSDVTDHEMECYFAQGVTELTFQVENQLEISPVQERTVKSELIESPTGYQGENCLWVLETPMVPNRRGTCLLTQLATDHPILPLTPLTPRQFLSPGAVKKYETALRSTNQMPDEISRVMIPEPDVIGRQWYPSMREIIEQIEMQLDENLGSLDMELRWDPLTQFYGQIELAKQSLESQNNLELKLNSSDADTDENVRALILRQNQVEDLIKYDTLMPALERESLDSSIYSQSSVVSLNCSETRGDGIAAKPKVQISDHTAIPGVRVGIPEICTFNHNSLLQTIDKSMSESINQIDSIDSFLMLRQKRQSPREITPNNQTQTQPVSRVKRVCRLSTPKHTSKLIIEDVPLNKLYREAIDLLTAAGEPLLRRIQGCGHLQDSSFISLVRCPEVIQFLLREHKHQWLEQDMPTESATWYKLNTICQLFCLVSSGAALLGTSLNAAIDVLFGSVNKYKVLIQDSLVTIGNSLVGLRERTQNSFHPKIIKTISILLEKKENTLAKLLNACVIVFDSECTFNLAGEMLEILKSQVRNPCVNLIKAPCDETYDNYHEVLLRAFDISHCLLCESSVLNHDSFPWKRISLMILYNLKDTSKSVAMINEKTQEHCRIHVLKASMESDLNNSLSESGVDVEQKCDFMICSTEVSEEQGLLELIETRCNLYVVERDYIAMGLSGYSADLIVNESTGILLVNLTRLARDGELMARTVEKLHSLKIPYSTCYVLAYTRSTEEYLSGDGPRILAALNSAISELQNTECKFELRGTTEIQGVADLIRTIVSESSNRICPGSEIEIEASEQEKWLLSLKCINSLAALSLLAKYDLRELIDLDLDQLKQQQQRIPTQCLVELHKVCYQNRECWSTGELITQEKDYCSNGTGLLKDTLNKYYPMSCTTNKPGSIQRNKNDVAMQYPLVNNSRLNRNSGYSNLDVLGKDVHQFRNNIISRGANSWSQAEKHNYITRDTKQNSRNSYTNPIEASRGPTGFFSEGLLAFQKLEADPGEGRDPIEQRQTAFRNELYTPDNIDCIGEETMDLRQQWGSRELSCKQVPGLSQTKLMFK